MEEGMRRHSVVAALLALASVASWGGVCNVARAQSLSERGPRLLMVGSAAAALTQVLLDADVDVLFSSSGSQAALVKRPLPPAVGSIQGRVTDKETGTPLVGVSVTVVGTALGNNTDEEGHYRIVGVTVGPATVTARRIGYGSLTQK